jgi:hypothetical protein
VNNFLLLNFEDEAEATGVAEAWACLAVFAKSDGDVAEFLQIFEPWAREWTAARLNS